MQDLPNVYFQFMDVNFYIRRKPGKFNMIASDQCIEQTINREQKCRGGITGFTTSVCTVERRVLISHVTSKALSKIRENLGIGKEKTVHKDIGSGRIAFDEACAVRPYEVFDS